MSIASAGGDFAANILKIIEDKSYRDPSIFNDLLAADVVLHTPRFWKPITNRDWMMGILSMAPQVIDDFSYHRIWVDGADVLMEFRGTVNGKSLHGIDIFTLDETGRVKELTVMVRPPNVLAALGEKEDALLARLFGAATQAEFDAANGADPTAPAH